MLRLMAHPSSRSGDPGLLRPRVLAALACPHCGGGLDGVDGGLGCAGGHRFDLARQGYASLLQPGAGRGTADTAAMVAAREQVLAAGHLAPLTAALAALAAEVAPDPAGLAVDLGAGTGHHLAAVLDALPGWDGLAVDLSKPALRRAARAHPRMGAVATDTWRPLPLRDGVAGLVLAVFAPRHLPAVARLLAPGGAFLLATPAPEHLAELVADLGLLAVDPRKAERLARDTAGLLVPVERRPVRAQLHLPPADLQALAAMGPSAHHRSAEELRERLGADPDPRAVTLAVDLTVYRAA